MAVYLYNLGFSASNAVNGNFTAGGSGINASNIWFQYNGPGLPNGVGSYVNTVPSVLPTSNWSPLTQVPSTFNAGSDYLILRIFNSDNNPGNYLVRTSVIFGQGDGSGGTPNGSLQSPFRTANGNALPVISIDGSVPPPPSPPSWSPAPTDSGNSASWTYCLGQIHNPTANVPTVYIFNVGATVFDRSGIAYYSFGIDPRMKVGGMGVPLHKDAA